MAGLSVKNALVEILPTIAKYPAVIQVPLLKCYILYLLKNDTKEEVLEKCRGIRTQLIGLNDSITPVIDGILRDFGISAESRSTDFEKLGGIHEKINELKLALNCISSLKESDSFSDLIFALIQREKNTKKSMEESVGEMFDRVLMSLDPEKAERYLDQSIERQGVEKKAALYDAMCEKYEQIFDYNESGLLQKDYKRLFSAKVNSQAE